MPIKGASKTDILAILAACQQHYSNTNQSIKPPHIIYGGTPKINMMGLTFVNFNTSVEDDMKLPPIERAYNTNLATIA